MALTGDESPGSGPRLTRRRALGYGALVAGAVAAGGGSVSTVAAAAPTGTNPVTVVWFNINWQTNWNQAAVTLVQDFTDANFNSKHKGIRAQPTTGPWGNASGVYAQVLAGDAASTPAVLSSCCGDFAIALPMLENLSPWFSKDNINPQTMYSPGQLLTFTEPTGLYGVPAYTCVQPLFYSQTLLDDLGLAYPDPAWDYTEATRLWRSIAGKASNGQWRYGSSMQWYQTYFDGGLWLLKGFGGELMDPTRTRCLLGMPESIAAANWIYPLIWDKVLINRGGAANWTSVGGPLLAGTCGFTQTAGFGLSHMAAYVGNKIKWDIVPMPSWPVRRASNVQVDYFGMNAAYPNKELAWELFKFLAVDQATEAFVIKLSLTEPKLLSMWDQWEAIVTAAAPPLRGKQLKWYAIGAQQGWGFGHQFWKYDDSTVESAMGTILGQIWNHQMDPAEGYPLLAKQIDAMQAAGQKTNAVLATEEAAQAKALAAVKVGPTTQYPAPSMTGVGVPPTEAKNLVVVGPGGSYTLLGDGWDMWSSSDNTVFACAPMTATEGEWSCRVTMVTNLTCPHLSQWSKVGIGAFGDLSDDSPAAYPHVTGAHQIEWQYRIVPGLTPSGASGLLPTGVKNLMALNTKPAANYLLAPLWLKISRKGQEWTPWASMNGKTWTQINPPAVVRMAGCWVGIYACAHNGSFGNKGYIRATIDNLSFTPTHFMQMGNTGTPPAAGPVPKNWATMTPAGM